VGGPRNPYKVFGPTTSFNPGQQGEKRDRSIIFQISAEVESAVYEHRPVVALETTIYTHGFPYPDNVSLALDLEKIVRANGAVPATIGIIDGVAKIGLTKDEIERLASSAGNPDTMKVSRRDLPYILGLVRHMIFSFLRCTIGAASWISCVFEETLLTPHRRVLLDVRSMAARRSLGQCSSPTELESKSSGQAVLEACTVEVRTRWTSQPISLNSVGPLWLSSAADVKVSWISREPSSS
jgi:hypothetical protein